MLLIAIQLLPSLVAASCPLEEGIMVTPQQPSMPSPPAPSPGYMLLTLLSYFLLSTIG